MEQRLFTPVWHKYRPAILRLMINAAGEPQQYQLSPHEFHALKTRKKSSYDFTLHVSNGRAQNNIKDSGVAQDLLAILQLSPKGSELMEKEAYEISLDKKFVLHVKNLSVNNN